MFRRGGSIFSESDIGVRMVRPIMHFTALCWLMGLGVVAS